MARAGVTYHLVAKAAATIKTQGQEPTVDRVREYLGTGSKSTIAPLLKRENWQGRKVIGEEMRSLRGRMNQQQGFILSKSVAAMEVATVFVCFLQFISYCRAIARLHKSRLH